MINIAIFASGSGTNAENLLRYFSKSRFATIKLILTNNPKAGVINRARKYNVPSVIFSKNEMNDLDGILPKLKKENINFIILAGFLLLIPTEFIKNFHDRIINLHPALLPLHGGKGFYGDLVHESVIKSGAIMSGITIHHVNEKFDEGEIIFQAACHVSKNETPATLAAKIHQLEYKYFPIVIEKLIQGHP